MACPILSKFHIRFKFVFIVLIVLLNWSEEGDSFLFLQGVFSKYLGYIYYKIYSKVINYLIKPPSK